MQQGTDNIDQGFTVRLPDNIRPAFSPSPEPPKTEPDSRKKSKKGSSTTVVSVLDRIFSAEKEQTFEALAIQADSSIEFRGKLELSGNKYKIEKMVAMGGFARVFQAEDRFLGRKAIVKSLKEELLQDEKAVEHFIAEAKLNSQLDHPGIVPLFSLDTDSAKGLHLAMQKVSGITLKVYLERCRTLQLENHFSQKIYNKMLAERLELFLHICDTISYCHDRGVLHNDLKPDNIMIGRYGQVYVMDWGLATMEGGKRPDRNVGSPAYMAPERLCSCVLTRQTDIFALGMILNELVTLRPSIESSSISTVIERICTKQFEPSSCVDAKRHISPALRAIIEKAREPRPQVRYTSVQTLADDVRHYLFHEEVSAYPDSFFQKAVRYLFHHRFLSRLLLGAVICVFLGLIGYNIYNAALITRKANREALRKLTLVKGVDQKGEAIGKSLLLFQDQTTNMGAALSIEFEKKLYDTNAPFYWNEDFAPKSQRRPPGLIHTAAYKGRAITFANGTFYRFKKGIEPEEIQDWANNFRAQQSQHFANVLSHIRQKGDAHKSDKMKLFYEHGSTVLRIICVLNNGLAYCYPGRYEPMKSLDSFIPEYIRRELRTGQEFAWSSPYSEPTSGLPVISCWNTISTLRGNKIGVIGMVMICEDLLKDFQELVRQDEEPSVYMLIDSEMRIIYDSKRESGVVLAEESGEHYSYPWYSEVIQRIRKNPARNQFSAVLNGKKYIITWKKVPSSDWLLIQHAPAADQRFSGRPFRLP